MKLTPVRTILVFTIILAFTIGTRSTKCTTFLSKKLYCWASCDLANCGKVHSNPKAFIECSWTLSNLSHFDLYNVTAILHNNQGGSKYIKCNATTDSHNLTEGRSSSKFFLSDCTLLKPAKDHVVAVLNVKKGEKTICTKFKHFKICQHAKPDPPIITKVIQDEYNQQVRIITSSESCTEMQLDYHLTYTRTNGITTRGPESSEMPIMSLKEASLYQYSLKSTKEKKIYSDPTIGSFLTKPVTAVDGPARVLCRLLNETRYITISWKKTGLIDYFLVKLADTGNNSVSHEVKVTVNLKNQTEHSIDVSGFFSNLNTAYELAITAYNAAGKSSAHRQRLSQIHCRAPPELNCDLKEVQQRSITVEWHINREKAKFEVEFRHHGTGKLHRTESDDAQGQITQSGLKECSQYDISISATMNDIKQGFCKLKGSTLPPAPEVELTESARKLHIQIKNSTRKICSNDISYDGYYYIPNSGNTKPAEFHIEKGRHSATLRHLQPNTEYTVFVAANNGNNRKNSTWFHKSAWTLEAAPDEPPQITTSTRTSNGINIAWTQSMNKNGEITSYEILVHKNGNIREDLPEACNFHPLGYLCIYKADQNFVGIKGDDEARNVSIRACAVDGKECSNWSDPSAIEDYEESSELLIVLCAACGAMMVLVLIVGVIYYCRSTGPQPMRPRLHPDILKGIQHESEKLKGESVDIIQNF